MTYTELARQYAKDHGITHSTLQISDHGCGNHSAQFFSHTRKLVADINLPTLRMCSRCLSDNTTGTLCAGCARSLIF